MLSTWTSRVFIADIVLAVPRYEYRGRQPEVAPDAFVAPDAVLVGDVVVRSGASVWFGCVLRGDMDRIEIGARSNVQDNSTIHTDAGGPTVLAEDVTVGHAAMIHSSLIERNVLVGSGAVLSGRNVVGAETLIGAGAVLGENVTIPPRSVVVGVPARVVRTLRSEDERWTIDAAEHYADLAAWYRDNLREIE